MARGAKDLKNKASEYMPSGQDVKEGYKEVKDKVNSAMPDKEDVKSYIPSMD